jgi:hypothetical protein
MYLAFFFGDKADVAETLRKVPICVTFALSPFSLLPCWHPANKFSEAHGDGQISLVLSY